MWFIQPVGFEGQFDVLNNITSQGIPYDFSSIMHFRHNAFSRAIRQKSTVLPRNQTIPISKLGISSTGTDLDFFHINLLYCEGMAGKIILHRCAKRA